MKHGTSQVWLLVVRAHVEPGTGGLSCNLSPREELRIRVKVMLQPYRLGPPYPGLHTSPSQETETQEAEDMLGESLRPAPRDVLVEQGDSWAALEMGATIPLYQFLRDVMTKKRMA